MPCGKLLRRIDLHYGRHAYSVGGRDVVELQAEINSYFDKGGWLLVNDGEGSRRDAYLWLTRGSSIAVNPIPDESPAEQSGPPRTILRAGVRRCNGEARPEIRMVRRDGGESTPERIGAASILPSTAVGNPLGGSSEGP